MKRQSLENISPSEDCWIHVDTAVAAEQRGARAVGSVLTLGELVKFVGQVLRANEVPDGLLANHLDTPGRVVLAPGLDAEEVERRQRLHALVPVGPDDPRSVGHLQPRTRPRQPALPQPRRLAFLDQELLIRGADAHPAFRRSRLPDGDQELVLQPHAAYIQFPDQRSSRYPVGEALLGSARCIRGVQAHVDSDQNSAAHDAPDLLKLRPLALTIFRRVHAREQVLLRHSSLSHASLALGPRRSILCSILPL
mmetsp:Transcript_78037/g.228762  ORF Transcript_78037/g.228762 Transcript_78037/m.228762 type:complete len:252 (+) Transcript_78037:926-1681(+)